MSRKDLIDTFSRLYPLMLDDLTSLIHEYFVPCRVTWQSITLEEKYSDLDYRLKVREDFKNLHPIRTVVFPRVTAVESLRTTPFTDCTFTQFIIHVLIRVCSRVGFRSTSSEINQQMKEEQTFQLPSVLSGPNFFQLSFNCIRQGTEMVIYCSDISGQKSFELPNGHALELVFSNPVGVNGIKFIEIL